MRHYTISCKHIALFWKVRFISCYCPNSCYYLNLYCSVAKHQAAFQSSRLHNLIRFRIRHLALVFILLVMEPWREEIKSDPKLHLSNVRLTFYSSLSKRPPPEDYQEAQNSQTQACQSSAEAGVWSFCFSDVQSFRCETSAFITATAIDLKTSLKDHLRSSVWTFRENHWIKFPAFLCLNDSNLSAKASGKWSSTPNPPPSSDSSWALSPWRRPRRSCIVPEYQPFLFQNVQGENVF